MHPSLILLDLMMPVMDGWEFLARRSADLSLQAIPVVVMTAHRFADESTSLLNVAEVLHKPFDLDEVLNVAKRYAT